MGVVIKKAVQPAAKAAKLPSLKTKGASPTGGGKNLKDTLTEDQLKQVEYELLKGTPHQKVAAMIQEEFGYFKDVSASGLRQFIQRYHTKHIKPREAELRLALTLPPGVNPIVALEEVSADLEVLTGLATLVHLQKGRVAKMAAREKDMPMLFNTLGGEIKTLATLYEQYAELSFDIGRMVRVPQVTKVTKNGNETLIQSSGREHVVLSIETNNQIEQASKEFFSLLNSGKDVTDTAYVMGEAKSV